MPHTPQTIPPPEVTNELPTGEEFLIGLKDGREFGLMVSE